MHVNIFNLLARTRQVGVLSVSQGSGGVESERKMLGCNCDGGNTRVAGLRGLGDVLLDTTSTTKAVSPAGKLAVTGAVGVLFLLGFVALAKRRA
jgi:hypothetical protein